MENLISEAKQPIHPEVENKPTRKSKKILLFLFIFLGIDFILGFVYYYVSGGIDTKNLFTKFTKKTTPTETTVTKKGNEVKILSLAYIPLDNKNLDLNVIDNSTGDYSNLAPDNVKQNVENMNIELASDLETGTKYHYYKNNKAQPALNYTFYNKIYKFKTVPFTDNFYINDPNVRIIDYNAILGESDICDLVDNKGVNEVWIWTYTNSHVKGWASNMSGPYGDISNSNLDPTDMPICKSTYTVYLYDYGKDISDALLKHIRQFETLFTKLNIDLFWYKYVGFFTNSKWEGNWDNPEILVNKRRCGSDFFPPNAKDANDWESTDYVPTDCTNWDPNGNSTWEEINCGTWQCTNTGFYVFWMQNIPGPNNNLTYNGSKLRNWWDFIGNFDEAMKVKRDLVY